MQSTENKNIVFLRLFPDEDVNKQIKNACQIHKINTAVILSGIGQLKNVQLGYFKEKGNYTKEIFNTTLEILSLNGNICKENDDYSIHIHSVLGNENKNTLGGHFFEGTVSVTAEIILLKIDIKVKREVDNKTGLKMLHFT